MEEKDGGQSEGEGVCVTFNEKEEHDSHGNSPIEEEFLASERRPRFRFVCVERTYKSPTISYVAYVHICKELVCNQAASPFWDREQEKRENARRSSTPRQLYKAVYRLNVIFRRTIYVQSTFLSISSFLNTLKKILIFPVFFEG